MNEYTNAGKDARDVFSPSQEAGGKTFSSSPGPEVPGIPKRRRFTKEYKFKILKELEVCNMPGGRGMILRREGLFSSQISQWKTSMGSSKKKTKSNSLANENARLKRRVARLEATLEKKDYIIEAQKKMSEILDNLSKTSKEPPAE